MADEVKDNVNHPTHYEASTSIECIEAMELAYGSYEVELFCRINAFKYIWRHKHKNGLEDLEKAQWYLNKAIELEPDKNALPDDIIRLQKLLDIKKKQWQESH